MNQRRVDKQVIEQIKNPSHLHSKIDPIKEAEVFCARYEEEIYKSDHLVVFGVGQGYHLNALIKKVRSIRDEVNIFCIDPNRLYIDQYQDSHIESIKNNNIKFSNQPAVQLFNQKDFISFLVKKPSILVHKSSYDHDKEYYKEILTYRPGTKLQHYKGHIKKEIALILDEDISNGKTLHEMILLNDREEKLSFKSTFIEILKHI